MKGEYKCLECEENFENKIQAIKHGFYTKHQNYELIATEIKLIVKCN